MNYAPCLSQVTIFFLARLSGKGFTFECMFSTSLLHAGTLNCCYSGLDLDHLDMQQNIMLGHIDLAMSSGRS